MTVWAWISAAIASAVHDRQLAEHGGPAGLRNEAGLQSALARPLNLNAYGKPDAAELAAAYAFGLARDHPFVDGNKRTAWVLPRLFLELNGCELRYSQQQAIDLMERLAAGELSEDELAAWLRERISGA